MTLDFRLPRLNPYMTSAVVECVHAQAGATLKSGAKLLDVRVDLGEQFAQQCPPVSYFRIILREHAVLRELRATCDASYAVEDTLALFTTSDDEPIVEPASRTVRIATAAIVRPARDVGIA